jgi:cell division protein FtsA
MARSNIIISALDIGSGSIKGIIAQKRRDREEIGVLSQVCIPSEGVKRGVVLDSDLVSERIIQALAKLRGEVKPQRFKEIFVNIGGSHIVSKLGHGAVAISRADQKVSPDDVERVIEEAKAINLTSNQEILDIFPEEFIVDSEAGLKDVIGMKGIKLEVNALALCVFSPYLQKLIGAILAAELEIAEIIPSPLAAAKSLLSPQQKELGTVLVDIGAETTGVAVYEDKNLIHLAVLPVGSAHITRDIAIAVQADIDVAEEIKKKFGTYIFQNKRKKEKINIGKGELFVFDTKKLVKAGRARVAEIFNLVSKELKKINKQEALPAGVILTGGGSKLPGIVNFVKKELKLPVRKGVPKGFIGLEEDPSYSVLCGLIMKGIEEQNGHPSVLDRGVGSKIKRLFRIFIP